MSIQPYTSQNQTGLVPQTLLGYSTNGQSAIEILPTSITIAGNLNTPTPIYVGISASTGLTTTLATGLDVNCDFNMNSNNITNIDTLSSTNTLTLNADSIQNNPTATFQVSSGGNVDISSGVGGVQISSPNDYINFITPNSTYFNLATELTGDGTIYTTNINSNSTISINPNTDIILNTPNGDTQLNTNGSILVNTQDLNNGGNFKWNNYLMGMSFFRKWNGAFTYPQTGTNNWDIVRVDNFAFPSQFLYGTWSVNFGINCWNVGSAVGDKGLAVYIDFIDGNSNVYNGFAYNQSTPWAEHFNTSTYTATSQNPMSITMIDYFDFSGAVNDLQIRLWWYGDQSQTQEFNISTQFTLMTLI